MGVFMASGLMSRTFAQDQSYSDEDISSFAKRLKPLGRILELEGYFVWGTSPIVAPDGKIHLFFSRWDAKKGMGGWINGSEIAHAIADRPEGPYVRYSGNPIIDYSKLGNNRQLEDGNVFMEDQRFYMLARDMGRFDHQVGIILESDDGIRWSEPKISYFGYSN